MTPATSNGARRHIHKPNGHTREDTERCPWCGSQISRKEFAEIKARIEGEEKARLAKLEKALAEKAHAEIHKAKLQATELAQKEVEKVKVAALVEVAAVRKQSQIERNAIEKKAKEAAKAALLPKITEAVNAEKTQWHAEKLRLTSELEALQRRVENTHTPPFQRGEPAEIDLFGALQTAFPGDKIWRVPKGQRGGDVVMEVVHGGEPVGKIVFDAKNYSPRRWSNAMPKKLRADQLAEGAAFGILVSTVFPSGAEQLHLQDGVVVASPQRVIVLTHLMRRQLVENHRLKLTAAARDEKAEKLLAYIVSPTCTDLLDRIVTVSDEMAALDRAETAAHQKTWSKRADFIRAVQDIHSQFTDAVSAIIAGDAA